MVEHVDARHWPTEAVVASLAKWSQHAGDARRFVAKNRVVLTPDFLAAYDAFGERMKGLDGDTTMRIERIQAARTTTEEARQQLERLERRALKS
jgi:hypothetical protein